MFEVSGPQRVNKLTNWVYAFTSRTKSGCGFKLEIPIMPPTAQRLLQYRIGNPEAGLRHKLCSNSEDSRIARQILRSGYIQ